MITGFSRWIKHIFFAEKSLITYQPELIQAISTEVERRNRYQLDPSTPLREIPFIVFDTETTGFYPYAGDQLISIGAVRVCNGKIYTEQTFHEWINPYRDVPEECSTVTGVTAADLQAAPPALIVIYQFLKFTGPHYLVAHCADFDMNFINTQLKKYCKQKIKHSIIDTLTLAYHLHPTAKSHKLDFLLERYHIPIINRHHALGDALMTAQLLVHLLAELERELGVTTLLGLDHLLKSMHILQSPSL
ncbi:MAG TPA: exonuclease domain-containing protein [Bacillota bacterium]|nr:exonuclease domain-containing protein [Bacillota bacterium]